MTEDRVRCELCVGDRRDMCDRIFQAAVHAERVTDEVSEIALELLEDSPEAILDSVINSNIKSISRSRQVTQLFLQQAGCVFAEPEIKQTIILLHEQNGR